VNYSNRLITKRSETLVLTAIVLLVFWWISHCSAIHTRRTLRHPNHTHTITHSYWILTVYPELLCLNDCQLPIPGVACMCREGANLSIHVEPDGEQSFVPVCFQAVSNASCVPYICCYHARLVFSSSRFPIFLHPLDTVYALLDRQYRFCSTLAEGMLNFLVIHGPDDTP
jgi:hypothetical protein